MYVYTRNNTYFFPVPKYVLADLILFITKRRIKNALFCCKTQSFIVPGFPIHVFYLIKYQVVLHIQTLCICTLWLTISTFWINKIQFSGSPWRPAVYWPATEAHSRKRIWRVHRRVYGSVCTEIWTEHSITGESLVYLEIDTPWLSLTFHDSRLILNIRK